MILVLFCFLRAVFLLKSQFRQSTIIIKIQCQIIDTFNALLKATQWSYADVMPEWIVPALISRNLHVMLSNDEENQQQLNTVQHPNIINCISLIKFIPDILLHFVNRHLNGFNGTTNAWLISKILVKLIRTESKKIWPKTMSETWEKRWKRRILSIWMQYSRIKKSLDFSLFRTKWNQNTFWNTTFWSKMNQ